MVTTFYGGESFGGDAVFVDRLARALVARRHSVDVVHCSDAYRAVRGSHRPRPHRAANGVRVHRLASPLGRISPLWTQQTARPGPKGPGVRRLVAEGGFDVVHVHNVSLIGLSLLEDVARLSRGVTLMTAHDHWLLCPTHILWKLGREQCVEPACLRCTLHARRPPQLWRRSETVARALAALDCLLVPSEDSLERHRGHGIGRNGVALPPFVPAAFSAHAAAQVAPRRPYVAAAGRLIAAKGFQRVVPLMRELPELDLRLAGAGPFEAELRGLARDVPNVSFEGWLEEPRLASLIRGARAVVVPSLAPESFGYVAAEALAIGRPVVVHDAGALPSLVRESDGGIVYRNDDELLAALRLLAGDPSLADRLGARGAAYAARELSEERHVGRYLELIASLRRSRRSEPLVAGA